MRVVTVDLDGTLLPGTTAFEVVLAANGFDEFVRESDARFFAGEISLEECFWEQWAKVQRLRLQEMHHALRDGPWMANVREGAALLRGEGLALYLLTDQPSTLADFAGRWGFGEPICSPVEVKDGVQISIEAQFDKWANLSRQLTRLGVEARDVCHVGNGANDVPVWEHVGASVAVNADDEVASRADTDLGPCDDFLAVAKAIVALRGAPHGKMESNS